MRQKGSESFHGVYRLYTVRTLYTLYTIHYALHYLRRQVLYVYIYMDGNFKSDLQSLLFYFISLTSRIVSHHFFS